ncbi:MAG: adenosine deaminase [Rhodobacteraceae bacterium]|nr:adenosine deaminase [Paracoccaceae bacterium]
MSFADMPKVELHLHLEGAAPPGFIRGLAQERKLDISNIFTPDGTYEYRDFWHFLDVYEAASSCLQSPEDYARVTTAVLAESAASGVVYSEAFLSPDFCGGRDMAAWKEYLTAICEAADKAEAEHGIIMRGIVTPIRHFGPEKAREVALCAQETAGDWVTGFGIAGDERAGNLADFTYAFDMAREAGLRLTAHAGEWCGPDEVIAALNHLKVERIGHGVRAIEDPNLLKRLASEGVVLEVCPGSNVTLGVYSDLKAHPVKALRDAGVKVSVSTDDPPFFYTSMTDEFNNLSDAFGWGEEDFNELNAIALAAAFCDDQTRARVKEKLEKKHV